MIHILYCIVVWWVVVNVAAFLTFGCLVYGKEIKSCLRSFPKQCMRAIDRGLFWAIDKVTGKGEEHD